MTDAFWISFFGALPALIAGTTSAIIGVVNSVRINKVHKQINSRMDELLVVTAKSSKAEGIKEEFERVK